MVPIFYYGPRRFAPENLCVALPNEKPLSSVHRLRLPAFLWTSYSFPTVSYSFPLLALCLSCAAPILYLCFSYNWLMPVPWLPMFARWFPYGSPMLANAFPIGSLCFPIRIPYRCFPMALLCVSYRFIVNKCLYFKESVKGSCKIVN